MFGAFRKMWKITARNYCASFEAKASPAAATATQSHILTIGQIQACNINQLYSAQHRLFEESTPSTERKAVIEEKLIELLQQCKILKERLMLFWVLNELSELGYTKQLIQHIVDSFDLKETMGHGEAVWWCYYHSMAINVLCSNVLSNSLIKDPTVIQKAEVTIDNSLRKLYTLCTAPDGPLAMKAFGKALASINALTKVSRNKYATKLLTDVILNVIIENYRADRMKDEYLTALREIRYIHDTTSFSSTAHLSFKAFSVILLENLNRFEKLDESTKIRLIYYSMYKASFTEGLPGQIHEMLLKHMFSRDFSKLNGEDLMLLGYSLTNIYLLRNYIQYSKKNIRYLKSCIDYINNASDKYLVEKREILIRYVKADKERNLAL